MTQEGITGVNARADRHGAPEEKQLRPERDEFQPDSIAFPEGGHGDSGNAQSVTETLAAYTAQLRFEDLPAEVVDTTKLLILDNVGCALASFRTAPALHLRTYLEAIGGEPRATVFGSTSPLPASLAAWANAHAATLLSFDDSSVRLGHPGSATIPGAIAVAEELGCSGRDLITAIVAGYEVSLRVGAAIRPSPARAERVLGLATWQIFGAAAAAARLHGLDQVGVVDVFGLASQHAPVPFLRKLHGRPMGWLKNNYGWATAGAITAAALAAHGFPGSRTIFDGESGFWIMAGSDRCDHAEMTRGLGVDYRLLDVGFKPYGCCRWVHTAIDALRRLIREHALGIEDVERIEVATFGEIVNDFFGAWPQSVIEAQFHLPYLLALELTGGSSARGLADRHLDDPTVRAVAERVTGRLLDGADQKFLEQSLLPVRLTVRRRNDLTLVVEAERPTGAAGDPAFGRTQVIEKFMTLAEPVLGTAAAGLCDGILAIDDRSDASVFALAGRASE